MQTLNEPSNSNDRSADEHAARVLEARNQGFRVLYDTVLEVEDAAEERVHDILARNLLRLCKARGVVLCSHDANEFTLRLETIAREHDEPGGAAPPVATHRALPKTLLDVLVQHPILPFAEIRASLQPFMEQAGMGWTEADLAATYCLACAREGQLLALGLVWIQPGAKLKLKDVIRTYLNFMGMVLQRSDAVQALRESEGFVKSILDSMDIGILVVDPKTHRIVEINSAAQKLIGALRDDVVGRPCFGFICGAQPGQCPITDLGRPNDLSQRFIRTVRGENVAVLKGVVPVTRGGKTYLIESFTDIRDRLRTEAELQRAKEAAEDANRSKSEFLANMSHEIRTPMTAILGFADSLLERDLSEPDRLSAIQIIRRNGEHLLNIINDILDLSKLEAGKLVIEPARCSPIDLISEVRALMQVRADAKNLRLNVEYRGLLPETISTDPLRLRQILVNLIGNALKFTEAGEVRVTVHRGDGADAAGSDSARNTLYFDVLDTGIGMTAEQTSRLFQAFEQADTSTSRQYGGTGLGLMISKRLSAMLGGDITVTSQLGVGSVFRLAIDAGPLDGVPNVEACHVPQSDRPLAPPSFEDTDEPALANARLLLAEDGPDNQRLIAHFLRKAGADVTIVENGRLALETIEQGALRGDRPFDAVLMDMQMPEMDGYTATRLLRSRGHDSPIVALTAHAMAQDRAKCIECGCDEYVSKPIDRRKLIETLRRFLAAPPSSFRSSAPADGGAPLRPPTGGPSPRLAAPGERSSR